jgi:4-amino-4-deoxy-L-arabinose transferase-like glycosyltransferase
VRFAWSRPLAALAFYGFEGRPLLLDLRLSATRPPGEPLAQLALAEGTYTYGSFPVAGGWRRYRLLLPAAARNERTLSLSSTPFTPSGRDDRELGVALAELRVLALPPQAWSPVRFERALFLASFPPLIALACTALLPRRRTKHARPRAGLGTLGRVLRPSLAGLALLLAFLGALRPLDSSYLLPTIWLLPALLLALPWLPRLLRRAAALVRLRGWGLLAIGAGLAIALVGIALLRLERALPLGLGLLLLASALASLGLAGERFSYERVNAHVAGRKWEWLALLAITLAALALRLYRLDTLPLGLFRDEARHGLQALRIWQDASYRPIYVVYDAQLPALLFYLMAPLLGLLGPSPWATRLLPALLGALAPLALWWFARPIWGPRPALFAAASMAVGAWALHMSRWAFPVTLDPLLTLLALGLLWRALHAPASPRARDLTLGLLAGGCGGLAAYGYHSGRLAPLILAAAATIWLGLERRRWRAALPVLLAAAAGGLLALAPLLLFILSDTAGYMYRVERVSLFKDRLVGPHTPLGVLASNALRYTLMWHVAGDANARHNLPGAPMLDPLAGLLLVLGLWRALRRPARRATLLLLAWLGIGLLPGVFSGQAPHAMRSFHSFAPACILVGLGLAALLAALERGLVPTKIRARASARWPWALAAGLLAFSLAWSGRAYFVAYAESRAVYTRFNVVETKLGGALRELAAREDPRLRGYQLLVDEGMIRRDVFAYLAQGLDVGQCGQAGCLPRPEGRAILLIKGEASEAEHAEALWALGPGAALLGPGAHYPGGDEPIYWVYGVGPEAPYAYELLRARASAPGG